MLYTSFTFALFLFTVFILYWFIFHRNLKVQNLFLLISSYFFYGWWDLRFLTLLFLISASNYLIAILIQKNDQKGRKLLFYMGLMINIGTLIVFKYFNFFINGFVHLISLFGVKVNFPNFNIILPIGISFYIFLSISYIIDVYQHKLDAVRDFFSLSLTFSFFPIVLAGPVHRPISLLPQILKRRIFNCDQATDGLRQILWGLFMKIVLADNCAIYVNAIFSDYSKFSGSTLLIGIFLFTIQIYADFGGYSNIAIGIGKLLGFNIITNFAYPYFSRDIKEFWKRWNISLTTWFRDYVFLPIAYFVSRRIKSDHFYLIKTEYLIYTIGITATWILTGLWHGANYTFIIWGIIQGFFLVLYHVGARLRKRLLKRLKLSNTNNIFRFVETGFTFCIIMLSWIFFRAVSIEDAARYISVMFSSSIFTIPKFPGRRETLVIILLTVFFIIIEWLGKKQQYAIAQLGITWKRPLRWAVYYVIICCIFYFVGKEYQFIYFQF